MTSSKCTWADFGKFCTGAPCCHMVCSLAPMLALLRRFNICHLRAAPGQAAPRAGTVHRVDFC
ncbi:hypothetical protein A2U01_0101851 [Trifolium medium]|uniref:Uncharacterized protein n=1 Tax=Trifolium medium TaxID=97028 RepID=A0A392V2E7_9FABA|nr:hypothetical protein [Trifolium medium]